MIEMYSDGACSGNPGPGGYGLTIFKDGILIDTYNEYFNESTTNNRMELKAMILALQLGNQYEDDDVILYCDSSYCINSATNWIYNWTTNGWMNSKKQTVENVDLMRELYSLLGFNKVKIQKVSGHTGILGNELADALARNNEADFDKILKKYGIEYRKD